MAHSLPSRHGSVLAEVRQVRRAGLVRLRELSLPELSRIAHDVAAAPEATGEPSAVVGIERLLRTAVSLIGGGGLQTAAQYSLGLAQGTRDWPASDRRRRAAQVYGVSVERFRKHHELMVLGQITEQIIVLAGRQPADDTGGPPDAPAPLPLVHRTLRLRIHGRPDPATVRIHVHSVDLLRDVDVVLSPSNTYFVLPAAYKSSVAATLRRAAARLDPTGVLVADHLHDELREWAARQGTEGRAALPGTVAVTSAGALAGQGVRRIYHVAVAQPRPGTNDYDVLPTDVTRGVARAFALLAEETARHEPPLTSVCLPLLGAGRGGLTPLESFGALWPAVEAELARRRDWQIHFVVRAHARADFIERLLAPLADTTTHDRGTA
ncbi:hypothetical protein DEJ46_06610 [Streptomyces venezuelae]|uniref:Macro domain-containing protein n=1 Tax=Streptomyces venezuelae TaxID=54571 RepID=A0A5P2B1X4_STRVZ|nr:hypothetical protein DEJ46_06610 [Streptomyces venezuelae]